MTTKTPPAEDPVRPSVARDYDPFVELRRVRAKLAATRADYEAHGDDSCPRADSCPCFAYPFNDWYRKDVRIEINHLEAQEAEIARRIMGKDSTTEALRRMGEEPLTTIEPSEEQRCAACGEVRSSWAHSGGNRLAHFFFNRSVVRQNSSPVQLAITEEPASGVKATTDECDPDALMAAGNRLLSDGDFYGAIGAFLHAGFIRAERERGWPHVCQKASAAKEGR